MLPHDVAGEGSAVLLLHNGLCDRRMWDRQMETFAPSHRVVRCDLPGYGEAPPLSGPLSSAGEVLALMDALDVERASVVGNSLGAGIALDVWLAAPDRVRSLVLVAAGRSGWNWSDALRRSQVAVDAAIAAGDLDRGVELGLQMWLDGQRPPGSVGGTVRAIVAQMYRQVLENQRAADRPGSRRPRLQPPADVRVPTLVIVGDRDQPDLLEVADAYARDIVGAHKVVMHGVAHIPSLERPDEFDALVLEFLGRLTP